jgi:glycosyltransferase involved in cell wall biosynthesis
MQPYFSILIPSYNRPYFISKCLDSIIENKFNDYEVIISDDKSPQRKEVTEAVAPYVTNKSIKYFSQETNLGQPDNQNFLVNQANGKYDIIIGDDDKLYPGALQELYNSIEENPGHDLYVFGYTIIDENGIVLYSRKVPDSFVLRRDDHRLCKDFFIADIFPFWFFHPSVFCCPKKTRTDSLSYNNEVGTGEDYLFLFDILNKGKSIFVINKKLFFWRKNQNQNSTFQKNLSSDNFNNLLTRRNIYYHLLTRTDLYEPIRKLINTTKYRHEFLYNPLTSDNKIDDTFLKKIKLENQHVLEFKRYLRNARFFKINMWLYLFRILKYIRIVGIIGFAEITIELLQRMRYRVLIKNGK